tara:strand:+ start:1265 stop:1453 length:189 start_codon:yes stop_codon:yes gene_type:complete
MAKIDLKFIDIEDETTIQVYIDNTAIKIILRNSVSKSIINLDKSTAIRFAKTLRTEINKIQD